MIGYKRDGEIEQKVVIESCYAFTQNLLSICPGGGQAECRVGTSLRFERKFLDYIGKTDRVLIATI